MNEPEIHIAFAPMARSQLLEALQLMGRAARVVAMDDDYSVGPIAPDDPDVRDRWMHENLYAWLEAPEPMKIPGFAEYDTVARIKTFWRRSLAPAARKVAWVSRRCPDEYVGFAAWVSRLEGEVEVVDLTDTSVEIVLRDGERRREPARISHMRPEAIADHALVDLARPLDPALREHARETWTRLQQENALLRTLENGEPVSAPLNYYDELLLELAGTSFKPAPLVVVELWGEMERRGVLGVSHSLLMTRILSLLEAGRLEGRGNDGLERVPKEIRRR